jgi:ComF family protein
LALGSTLADSYRRNVFHVAGIGHRLVECCTHWRAQRWAESLLTLVYPDVCQICQAERATRADGYVGLSCRKELRFIVPPRCERCGLPFPGAITDSFACGNCLGVELAFSQARAAVAAQGMVLEVIHRWKYSRALWFEPFLAELLLREAVPALRDEGWDLIVPMPLHRQKETEREFNQARHLARSLSRATGLPVANDLVQRVGATHTQTKLSREERAENMRGAFGRGGRARLARGRRIVLVDDVLTTGATANACARVLKKAGARDVCVWTVARGLLH